MAFPQIILFLGLFYFTAADVSEIVGRNQYLPPKQGFNFDRPRPQFRPSQGPSSRPTPSYQPSAPTSSGQPQPTFATGPSYQGSTSLTGTPASAQFGQTLSQGNVQAEHEHHDHHEPGMPYDFEYQVKDDVFGAEYSRNEVSDGETIRGEYRVQLPDGRLQIVKYTADWKNGFNADVSYQGEPTYPMVTGGGGGNVGGSVSGGGFVGGSVSGGGFVGGSGFVGGGTGGVTGIGSGSGVVSGSVGAPYPPAGRPSGAFGPPQEI